MLVKKYNQLTNGMKTADSVPAACLKSCDPPHTIGQPVDAVTLKYVHRVTDAKMSKIIKKDG